MSKIKIITDSCSDLTPELMNQYEIDYVKMNTVLDGKTSPALLNWSDSDVKTFYNAMRSGKRVTTTQVPTEEFMEVFNKYLSDGFDVLYIGCSLRLSGSVNAGNVVAQKLLLSYPERKIFCMDSLNACIGEGMLAMEAAKMVKEGKEFDEIKDHILKIRNTVNQYCTVHSLDTLRKAGRVKGSAAFFGNLMGVKPIIISSSKGDNVAVKKVKGRLNSFNEIVNMLKETIVDSENQIIYLVHADCSNEEVELLKSKVKEAIPCKGIHVSYLGPIIGASCGPDTIALYAFGKEVTYSGE